MMSNAKTTTFFEGDAAMGLHLGYAHNAAQQGDELLKGLVDALYGGRTDDAALLANQLKLTLKKGHKAVIDAAQHLPLWGMVGFSRGLQHLRPIGTVEGYSTDAHGTQTAKLN